MTVRRNVAGKSFQVGRGRAIKRRLHAIRIGKLMPEAFNGPL